MRFLSNGHGGLAIFEDAVTCSGASVPENVQKPQRLCTKVGGLPPIDPRWGNDRRSIFGRPWPLGGDYRGDRLKSNLSPAKGRLPTHPLYRGSNTPWAKGPANLSRTGSTQSIQSIQRFLTLRLNSSAVKLFPRLRQFSQQS